MRCAMVLSLALLCGASAAQTVYKSVDRYGNVEYSATPPEGATELEQVPIAPGPTPEQQAAARARQQESQRAATQIDRQRQQRAEQEAKSAAGVEQAQQAVTAAEQALEQARRKKRTDYRDTSNPSRLKKSYYDRVRFFEEQLQAAQVQLEKEKQRGR